MRPVNAELISILVSQPIEAGGILSRIELHLAHLQEAVMATVHEQQAQARHEFMRDYLVSSHNALVSKLDNLTQEWRANHTRVCHRLDVLQTELEKQSSRMALIEDALDAAGRNASNRHAEILRRLPDEQQGI